MRQHPAGSLAFVELVRRYSNRSDLQERLAGACQRAAGRDDSQQEPDDSAVNGRASGVWRVQDRLSDEDVAEIIGQFRAGTAKHALAVQFGISLSSVKTLLRQRGIRRANDG